MYHRTVLFLPLALLLACPLGPKSEEETDDGAHDPETTGDPATSGPTTSSPSESTGTETGGQGTLTCEEELEVVKKQLEACLANGT